MGHKEEDIIREKLLQAETHVQWNKDRVWQSLDVAKPVRSNRKWLYYAAASVVVILSVLPFAMKDSVNRGVVVEVSQANPVKKVNPPSPRLRPTREVKGINLATPEMRVNEVNAATTRLRRTPPTLKLRRTKGISEEQQITPVLVEVVEVPLTEQQVAQVVKEKPKRRKIEAVVGIIPDANELALRKEPKLIIARFGSGQLGRNELSASTRTFTPFKTVLK